MKANGTTAAAAECPKGSEAERPNLIGSLASRLSDIGHTLLTFAHGDWRFRDIIEALPAAIYTTDQAGRITFYNEAAVAMWGRRPELGEDQWCGSWKLYWPDGRLLPHD